MNLSLKWIWTVSLGIKNKQNSMMLNWNYNLFNGTGWKLCVSFFLEFVFPIVLTFCKCFNKNTNANSAFLFIFCLFNLTQHHPPHSLGAYLSPFHSPLCRSTICIVIKLRNHFIIYLHFNLQLFCIYAVLMLSKFYGNFIYYSFSVYILNIIHRMAKHGMHIREDTGTSRKY